MKKLDRSTDSFGATLRLFSKQIQQSDLRLGQLLVAVTEMRGKSLFNIENDELEELVVNFISELTAARNKLTVKCEHCGAESVKDMDGIKACSVCSTPWPEA